MLLCRPQKPGSGALARDRETERAIYIYIYPWLQFFQFQSTKKAWW